MTPQTLPKLPGVPTLGRDNPDTIASSAEGTTMLNFYPWGLSVNVVRPLAQDLTRVSFLAYVWRPELLGQGAGGDLDRVERKDEVVVELVQKDGRYSPTREKNVHHFHRLLSQELASDRGVGVPPA